MNTSLANVSVTQLKRAVSIKGQIEKLEAQLGKILGGSANAQVTPTNGRKKRRKMSKAGRARIAAAAKARWAKWKAAKKK